mmetsp:Transcript_1590/g.3716  ORF Transcript_1590/g.3716 Transcript_1590/m.3716 type:complete len:404 (-) Transcript_1590:1067-2278(-)
MRFRHHCFHIRYGSILNDIVGGRWRGCEFRRRSCGTRGWRGECYRGWLGDFLIFIFLLFRLFVRLFQRSLYGLLSWCLFWGTLDQTNRFGVFVQLNVPFVLGAQILIDVIELDALLGRLGSMGMGGYDLGFDLSHAEHLAHGFHSLFEAINVQDKRELVQDLLGAVVMILVNARRKHFHHFVGGAGDSMSCVVLNSLLFRRSFVPVHRAQYPQKEIIRVAAVVVDSVVPPLAVAQLLSVVPRVFLGEPPVASQQPGQRIPGDNHGNKSRIFPVGAFQAPALVILFPAHRIHKMPIHELEIGMNGFHKGSRLVREPGHLLPMHFVKRITKGRILGSVGLRIAHPTLGWIRHDSKFVFGANKPGGAARSGAEDGAHGRSSVVGDADIQNQSVLVSIVFNLFLFGG